MIFGKHNFTTNYLNAVGYGDEFMADQIIIDEVARLIVEDKKDVVEALRKVGVNAAYRDNNIFVKALLVKEIENKNPEILKFLANKIILNQVDQQKLKEIAEAAIASKKNMKADGTTTQSKFGSTVSTILQNEDVQSSLASLISGGIEKVFSKNNTDKTANDQQLAERLKLNEMAAASASQKKKKILIIVAIGAGTLIVGGIVFFLVRRKYAQGGMIDGAPKPVEMTATPPVNTY